MKKGALMAIIAVLVSTAVYADHEGLGLGLVGGGGWGWGKYNYGYGNVGISLKIPSLPVFWAISLPYFGSKHFGFGLSGDFYFFDQDLVHTTMTNEDGNYNFKLDWYFGLGGYFHISFWEGRRLNLNKMEWESYRLSDFDFGIRVPVGLSWHIIKQLEMFVAIIPGLGIRVYPEWDNGKYLNKGYLHFAGSGEVGLRYWFQ